MSLVVREGFLMNPVVMMRAWSWLTCCVVVHFGSVVSVGMGEAHGWCEELAHTSINSMAQTLRLFCNRSCSVKGCPVESSNLGKERCSTSYLISTVKGFG